MKVNARKVVLEILNDCDKGIYSNKLIQDMHKREDIAEIDKNFISKIVYGVIENKLYLDFMIRKFSSIRLKKIDPSILNVLRLSVYQFLYMDKTPDSAVVNEAVKLTKKINHRHGGFVNGLLRNLIRDSHKIQIPKGDQVQYLSIKYSHPEWMVERWIGLFGDEFTEELLRANNATPHLSIRTNTMKINREDLMTKLQMNGIDCQISDIVEDGIVVRQAKGFALDKDPLFQEGYYTIQDESSMKIGEIMAPKSGEKILDLCAAPGGKTTHMAQIMDNQGHIVSCDVSDKKLQLIQENIDRMGLTNIELKLNDATILNEAFINQFDRVLVDAPCSGFGIIRRKPDIKYHKSMEDIVALSHIQMQILEHAGEYVKSGGTLVYSTCTIDPMENRDLIKAFLSKHNQFERVDIEDNEDMQLYPHVDETDGFYCCKLKKK